MKPTETLKLSALCLVMGLAHAAAHASDPVEAAAGLGQHPAVLIARRGPQVDETAKFYMHPARLSWNLSRPMSDGEHPAVLVARHGVRSGIEPNHFIVAHPAVPTLAPR